MKFEICDRKTIEERAKKPFDESVALISCTDMDFGVARLVYEPAMLLRLQFDDVSTEDFMDFEHQRPSPEEVERLAVRYHMITEAQAEQTAEFYRKIRGKAQVLICQCEHGESRSAAIAAAVAQYEAADAIRYFADDRYLPNKCVYRMVYHALTK